VYPVCRLRLVRASQTVTGNYVHDWFADYNGVNNTIVGNIVNADLFSWGNTNDTMVNNVIGAYGLHDYEGSSNIVESNTVAQIAMSSETRTIIRGVNDALERINLQENGGTHTIHACPPNSYMGDQDSGACKPCPPNTGTGPYGFATSVNDCDPMYFMLDSIQSAVDSVDQAVVTAQDVQLTALAAGQAADASTLGDVVAAQESAEAQLTALAAGQAADASTLDDVVTAQTSAAATLTALTTTASTQGAALTALTVSQATASTSVTALSTMVTTLTANLAALQANVTTSLAALQLIKRTPGTTPPGAPPSVITTDLPAGTSAFVTTTLSLGGYTTSTFGTMQATQLKAALAATARVLASSIHVTGVRAKAANAGRRSLSQAGGVDVDVAIATTAGAAAAALTADVQTLTAAVLRAAGLLSCTDLSFAAAPGLTTATPVDAVPTLPVTDLETADGAAAAPAAAERLDLLGLLVLLLLPAGGLGLWFAHKRAVNIAVAQAAATDKQAEHVAAPV
jgi:hypothetical protein